MEPTITYIAELLQQKNIKPSLQRIKVLNFLFHHRHHPSADEIYHGLIKDIPTLSKTTVYNTLNLLMEANLVRVLTIEDHETRYDIDTSNHGHFKCYHCHKIYDFAININEYNLESTLPGFIVHEKDVYFKGVCFSCQQKGSI